MPRPGVRNALTLMATEYGWTLVVRNEARDKFLRGEEALNIGYFESEMIANVDHRPEGATEYREMPSSGPLDRTIIAERILTARQEIVEWGIRHAGSAGYKVEKCRDEKSARATLQEYWDLGGTSADLFKRTVSPWVSVQ